jgi:6-phosphogluconolactonase (cycloisomerase 2 family)
MTVTGVSGSVAETTTFCVAVGVSTSSCTSTASSGKYYILNSTTLTGYSISSGTMTTISGASATFTNATAIAISSDGSYLFVASNAGITPFTISSTGALTQGTVFDASDSSIEALVVDPAGKWLLGASTAGILNAFPLSSGAYDTTSGRTVQSQSLNLGSGSLYPTGIAISPSGYTNDDIVAVAMGTTGTGLFTFTSGTAAGPLSGEGSILTPITGGNATAVAIDPQNRLLYIGETDTTSTTGSLRVYTISSTGVTPLNVYNPAGTGPHVILPTKDGSYVYAASWDADEITGYSVTTSALTALSSTIATGTQPNGLAEDSTGNFVLGISYGGTPTFDAYTLSSGTLTLSTSNSTVGSPVAIVAAPK